MGYNALICDSPATLPIYHSEEDDVPITRYQLTVRKGPQEGESYPLADDTMTLGRDPMADIVIADPEVSRQHVRFKRVEEGYVVQDLGSTNGTFLNGQRLGGEPVPVEPGDVVTMGGNVTLVFEQVGEEPAVLTTMEEAQVEVAEPEETRTVGVYTAPEVAPAAPEAADVDEYATYAFEAEDEDLELPSFDVEAAGAEPIEPEGVDLEGDEEEYDYEVYEEEEALPTFEAEPVDSYPPPSEIAETEGVKGPPGLPTVVEGERNNRNRNLLIAAIGITVLFCCCCLLLLVGLGYFGDIACTMDPSLC
ncbi:MAG: FHA domain-containing protein [Candidatus Promineifilaceae bacterium]|nr:FHA domain-containing protein [Candidatus Promineifilaceae bacterium]